MNGGDALRALAENGWMSRRVTGSHHQLGHPIRPGIVTVPHRRRDLPIGTLESIERQIDGRGWCRGPEPSTLEAALADLDFGDGVPILVPLPGDRETSEAA